MFISDKATRSSAIDGGKKRRRRNIVTTTFSVSAHGRGKREPPPRVGLPLRDRNSSRTRLPLTKKEDELWRPTEPLRLPTQIPRPTTCQTGAGIILDLLFICTMSKVMIIVFHVGAWIRPFKDANAVSLALPLYGRPFRRKAGTSVGSPPVRLQLYL